MRYAIGIDLGGTFIKGVLVNEAGEVQHQETVPVEDRPGESGLPWKLAIKHMYTLLRQREEGKDAVVGLAAPGLINTSGTAILSMPGRLAGLEGFVWSDFLGRSQTSVLNDAHAAIMAECAWGSGKNHRNVLMLTLGTGVGGGLFIDGKLHTGFLQRAGHIGHISMDAADWALDITAIPGSLEDAIGNATVGRRSYGKYSDTDQLVAAYKTGEPLATWVWLNSVQKLAVALCGLINTVAPDLIILGGGIAHAEEHLFTPLETFRVLYEWNPTHERTPVVKARYGSYAGALGAAAQALKTM